MSDVPFLLRPENRNPYGPHYYTSRRGTVLAIVIHITAGLEDLDGVDDHSAEKTARYAATTSRPVSWHSGSDADSSLDLLPASYTAFHCQGYNSRTYGHEISKRDTDWRDEPPGWVAKTIGRAAAHLAPKAIELGVPIRKARRSDLDTAIAVNGAPAGFIGHWELDPGRRSDPGRVGNLDTFPWDPFFAALRGPGHQEDDMTPEERAQLAQAVKNATEANNRASNLERWIPRIAEKLGIPFEELDRR